MIESFEYARQLGNFDQMPARLEQPNAAHENTADCEFAMQ